MRAGTGAGASPRRATTTEEHRPVPTGVTRAAVPGLGGPTDVLRALPDLDRLVALVGDWSQGEAVLAWDPLLVATSPFDCEAPTAEEHPGAFGGGWIGVWGYRLGEELEDLPPSPPRPVPQPAHRIGYYDRVLRLVDGTWWVEQLTGLLGPAEEARRAAEFRAVVDAAVGEPGRVRSAYAVGEFAMVPGPADHVRAVQRVREHVAAGDVFQVNLTTRVEAAFDGDPVALFCRGVDALAPARAALVVAPEGVVASLSPELFLRRTGRDVVTSPIKGTAPLDSDPARLVRSGKDRAENVMIVDLVRNDLGRVAEPGTVRVPATNRLERHAVWHLVSDVTARQAPEVGDGDLLRATFPPGSVTGAPKVRALEVVSELEATARETYTGAIGHLSPHAGLELNVAIRTFEIAGGRVWLGVGGGITWSSDPEAELAECFAKAGPLLHAVGGRWAPVEAAAEAAAAPRGAAEATHPTRAPTTERLRPVFETLLVRDGAPVDPEPHLERLAAALGPTWSDAVQDRVLAAVREAAAPLEGRHRLRVDADPQRPGVALDVVTSPLADDPAGVTLVPLVVPGGLGDRKWRDRPLLDASLPPERDQLVLDEDGAVLEAGRWALLAVLDDEVVAPRLDGRLLPSTGRRRVEAVLERAGWPLVERVLTTADLARAGEVVCVNALRCVVPVVGVDGVGMWSPGPVGRWLREELAGERRGRSDSAHVSPRTSATGVHVLFVDNYDSFVHNLVQHVTGAGGRATVVRNDALGVDDLERLCDEQGVTHVVVSPGPGRPEDAGVSVEVVRRLGPRTPVLGVCLGHQAIAAAYAGQVVRAPVPVHGRPSWVEHDGRGVHRGLAGPLVVARYHSLVVDEATLPADLEVTSRTPSGVVMGIRHRHHPVEGVQWHPESVLSRQGAHVLDRFLGR